MEEHTVRVRLGEKRKPRNNVAYEEGLILRNEPFTVTGLPRLENCTPHTKSVTIVEYHPIRFKDGTCSEVAESQWDKLYEPLEAT